MRKTITLLLLALTSGVFGADGKPNIICRYKSSGFYREGLAQITLEDLRPSLSMCTHLVYGHVGIDGDTFKVRSLNPIVDLDHGFAYFRKVVQLKVDYPHLKILLSVGGSVERMDTSSSSDTYLDLLLEMRHRLAFVNSAHAMLQRYGFDGIDLAWQFPIEGQPFGQKTTFQTLIDEWHLALGFDRRFSRGFAASKGYREGFSALVEELHAAFERDQLLVSVTINPRVTYAFFIEFHKIYEHADLVTLPTYDLWTPEAHMDEAFHPAWRNHSNEFGSIEHLASLIHGNIGHRMAKTIFAIQSYGRSWQLETGSTDSGVPPVMGLRQPGAEGQVSRQPGLLSYPEICANLPHADNRLIEYDRYQLRNGSDANGAYAYRLPDRNGAHGIWIGYEDPSSVADKVKMALECGAMGFSLVDLNHDDFRGTCGGEKFPLLSAISKNVMVAET